MVHILRAQNAAKRHGHDMCLCMCDLDNFKSVNDIHGHAAGDLLLCTFGQLLAGHLRQEDIAARIGGDEFCLLFTHTSAEDARVVLERMRAVVKDLRLPLPSGELGALSASFGVAPHREEYGSPNDLLEAADRALYQAKRQGRDQVVVG